ncbi:hypothetical protein KP509_08G044800 [Ceratopteris richardii]|nr:hypothetical protein KP509_08G044800 [Ceratopteris richardii]
MCTHTLEVRGMDAAETQTSVPDKYGYTIINYERVQTPVEAQIVQPPSSDGNDHTHADYSGTKHWCSMALDTLRKDEAHQVYDKGRKNILKPCSLTTEGIELAQPAPIYRFLNRGPYKVSSLSKTWDDLGRPHSWIPAHVHRTFHNLTTEDIKGARPNPKNMKLGNAARGTNPLDPAYKLPSCKVSPPFEPKFIRDNLNVDDIAGARSQHRVRFAVDHSASREVIEGSFPGWRPFYRRRFGKSVRDLCLQVQDINRPMRRMIRSGNSQAYLEIEGTHPKHLKQFQISNVRENHILQTSDIKGTEARSKTWISNVQRRKQEGRERTSILKEQEISESLARELLDTKAQGLEKDLLGIFKELDRDKSGKLTPEEIHTALRRLQVEFSSMELGSLASGFDTDLDGKQACFGLNTISYGYIDYQKLLLSISPVERKKRFNPAKLDSRVVALCLNQWIDRPWPDAVIKPARSIRLKQRKTSKLADTDSNKKESGKSVNFMSDGNSFSNSESQSMRVMMQYDSLKCDSANCNHLSSSRELNSKSCKLPLQLGEPFWPDEKILQVQGLPRDYFSLPQDNKDYFKELPKNPIKPLSEDEKPWEKYVGGTLFTGEGNKVGHGSYMTGYDWSRQSPQAARLPAKKRRLGRCQSLPNILLSEIQGEMVTVKSENVMTSSRASSRNKDSRGPAAPVTTRNGQRPMSASYSQAGKTALFGSPRSVLFSPMSSRSSWSPRSGGFSFQCTPRIRDFLGGSISARECLASRNQAERLSQRLQSLRKEDAAAVRSLC